MNVLFVVNHDVSRDWFGCYGTPLHTPHLDALAEGGFTFNRHYCQYPLCGPSRASFFSGADNPDYADTLEKLEKMMNDGWRGARPPETS